MTTGPYPSLGPCLRGNDGGMGWDDAEGGGAVARRTTPLGSRLRRNDGSGGWGVT